MANKWHEVMNTENYYALAISVYSEHIICPELAFEMLGDNLFPARTDREKYKWNSNGNKLWREMAALREIGWYWKDIAAYYGLTKGGALSIFSRARKKYGKGAAE